jgi:acetylornithine deacetylase/succinyl-diaminopimelate desuccinylase-like protein
MEELKQRWPNILLIFILMTGATDSRFLRERKIQAYGFTGLMISEGDILRAHGVDERIPISGIKPGLEFLYGLILRLAS